jgi:hypothetical protein
MGCPADRVEQIDVEYRHGVAPHMLGDITRKDG